MLNQKLKDKKASEAKSDEFRAVVNKLQERLDKLQEQLAASEARLAIDAENARQQLAAFAENARQQSHMLSNALTTVHHTILTENRAGYGNV